MLPNIVTCLCISLIWVSSASKIGPQKKLPGSRIVGGENASPAQFPYQAKLNVKVDGIIYTCGGSIVNEKWILTDGGCIADVYQGLVTVNGISSPFYDYHLSGYDPDNFATGIGLVSLLEPLVFNDYVQPVPLSGEVFDGQEVIVSGYGSTSDGGFVNDILRFVNLVTISNAECSQIYGDKYIHNETLCAGSDNDEIKSTCNGDTGDPLVILQDGHLVQVGVASFIRETDVCESGAPSRFTRVAPYLGWISSITGVNTTLS